MMVAVAGLSMTAMLAAQAKGASAPVEHWSGVALVHGQEVPVQLDLARDGRDGKVYGTFLNGTERSQSSDGDLTGDHLLLNFNYFARKLDGTVHGSAFEGTFSGATGTPAAVQLHREEHEGGGLRSGAQAGATEIRGDWEIAVKSPKGESAWTLRVEPFGKGEVKAVILRIDGDTGGLYGGYDASTGEYRISHFGAGGAALYSLKRSSDGTLLVTNLLRDNQQWTARRPTEARKEQLAPPTKATEQTGVVDPSKPLQFAGVTLAGASVSSEDLRFRDKVVIVAVGGSWCPNCHDEAPFLVELYNRFHARGLEVVNLSFEEEDQLKDPARLRAFVAKYHIPYTVLVAGTPDELNAKLPQGKNLNCWPTSFFIGRDGLVKETHAGFSGPATGSAHVDLKAETTALIEKLLAKNSPGNNL
jgi:thiol-disulfide isomerase/thioredoxin